ncbi:MAG: dUTP diphosphatase [Actinobacteria bacterium]|nr:dUTP diphosphatase [Actinomycetota bacterium]
MTGSYAPSYDRPVLEVPVMRLDPDLELPAYARVGDAGLDLLARETIVLLPAGGRALVPTGLAVAIPEGHAGFVQPRSGLALKHGVTCLNTPGLIDSGYRGELKVLLINTDPVEPFEVKRGERIAQLVVQRVEHVVSLLDERLLVSWKPRVSQLKPVAALTSRSIAIRPR